MHDEIQMLKQANENLRRRRNKVFLCLRATQHNLRRARAEAKGRKAYAEDLKAKIIEQHVELCDLTAKYNQLKDASDAAYVLVDKHTPYGRYVPLANVLNWLVESQNLYRSSADEDSRRLREISGDRHRAIGMLMDRGIYCTSLEEGIQELLKLKHAPRRKLRSFLRKSR